MDPCARCKLKMMVNVTWYKKKKTQKKMISYCFVSISSLYSCYFSYFLSLKVDEDVALDQAVKFCQIQMATSAQRQVGHTDSLSHSRK